MIKIDNIILSSQNNIEIAELNETYLKCKFIVCDFNVNRNGVALNRDTIESWYKSLIDMPIVGAIKGEDFGSHEATSIYSISNGSVNKRYKFNTDAFGVFTDVNIESINGNDTIVGTAKIWKRFENCCNIIQERIANNESLSTSWEISVSKQHEVNGVKVIDSGKFLSLCMLGNKVTPAYESNDDSLLQVAQKQSGQDNISQALVKDLIQLNEITEISESNQTDNKSDDNKTENNEGGHDNMASENNNEAMELLSSQVKELTQQVSELNVKLSEKDNQIETLTKEKEGFETQLSEKDDKIVELGGTIQTLNDTIAEKNIEISELQPIKEKYEQEMAEKEAKELAEKQEALKKEAISSKYVTEEDFANNEVLKEALSSCDEKTIKSFIADRVIEQAQKICKKDEDKKKKCAEEEKDIEEKAEVSLSSLQEYNYASELENDPMAKLIKSMQR